MENTDGLRKLINRAYLVMVALDENEEPTPVPGIIPETMEEKFEYEAGAKRNALRKQRRQNNFDSRAKKIPDSVLTAESGFFNKNRLVSCSFAIFHVLDISTYLLYNTVDSLCILYLVDMEAFMRRYLPYRRISLYYLLKICCGRKGRFR